MPRRPRTESALRFTGILSLFFCFAAAASWAAPVNPQQGMNVPCGIVTQFAGEVQIMDSSRTHLIEATPGAPVPCGGWVSTGTGWAAIRHRDGFALHLGAASFAEIPENNFDGRYSGEHVILYRGEVYGSAIAGIGELRMITATARARTRQGSMILVFDGAAGDTQLISVTGRSTLENRFETTRRVAVRGGEASGVNFKLLRVVPTTPRAVALAPLRAKLQRLNVDEQDQRKAFRIAKKRQARRFAASWRPEDEDGVSPEASRKLASAEARYEGTVKSDYQRHRPVADTEQTRKFWLNRLVAGQESGEKMLFPDKYYGRVQKVKVEVEALEDPRQRQAKRAPSSEEQERQRLIEELSTIRDE